MQHSRVFTLIFLSLCLFRICVVPTPVTLWEWLMLAQCATLTEAAQLLRMMDCKQHLLWHTNWVSKKKSMFMFVKNL